jgi:hypothetical protein
MKPEYFKVFLLRRAFKLCDEVRGKSRQMRATALRWCCYAARAARKRGWHDIDDVLMDIVMEINRDFEKYPTFN